MDPDCAANGLCVGGQCVCAAGYGDCNGNPNDGCEAYVVTDPNNCGGCNLQCSLPNATEACNMGFCVVGSCDVGYANCNNLTVDGCEVGVQFDNNNCGVCGNVCPNPLSCVNAICQ